MEAACVANRAIFIVHAKNSLVLYDIFNSGMIKNIMRNLYDIFRKVYDNYSFNKIKFVEFHFYYFTGKTWLFTYVR